MFTLFVFLLFSVPDCFRIRAALQAEILALRHQLLLLQRSTNGHRVRLRSTDRLLWIWLSRLWTEWRSALLIVKPETVIAWHQKGFRLYWTWKRRHPAGRTSVSTEVANFIRRMSIANPLEAFPWDSAPRYLLRDRDGIYGEKFQEAATWLGIREVLTAPTNAARRSLPGSVLFKT